jgi:hypothetical protein
MQNPNAQAKYNKEHNENYMKYRVTIKEIDTFNVMVVSKPFSVVDTQFCVEKRGEYFFCKAFFPDVSTTSAPDITKASLRLLTRICSGLFGTELDYHTVICRVTKGLTHRTFVTSSYKLKNMYYKTM